MKFYKISIFVLVISFTLLTKNTFCQTLAAPTFFDIYMVVAPNDNTMLFGDTLFHQNTQLAGKAIVMINDTVSYSNIRIRIGSDEGLNDLFEKSFDLNIQGNFQDGTSLHKTNNKITIGLGDFFGLNEIYADVELENSQGEKSPLLIFSNLN